MSNRRVALLALLLTFSCSAGAAMVVRDIEIRGLKSTHDWVVERELYFTVGDTVSWRALVAARHRLENLSVFSDADVSMDTAGTVVVELAEVWPILPVFGVKLARGSFSDIINDPESFWSNLDVMAGVRHINFRGNASELFAFGHIGASDGFFVGYWTRWLSQRRPYAVRARVQYLEVTDRHAAIFDSSRSMRDDGASLDVSTRQGAHGRIGLGVSYQRVQQESEWPAEGRDDRIAWIYPFAILDHRDLEWWPSRGGLAETRADFGFNSQRFIRSQFNLRGYVPLKSWFSPARRHRPPVLALQAVGATSTSSTPSHAHYYSGFDGGYRGYANDQAEAANVLSVQGELRLPITRETTFNVPFIGRWGRRWPLGIAGVLFAQRTQLQLDNTRQELLGYGAGIYLRVPYVHIAEFAYARSREGDSEYTFRLGVAY